MPAIERQFTRDRTRTPRCLTTLWLHIALLIPIPALGAEQAGPQLPQPSSPPVQQEPQAQPPQPDFLDSADVPRDYLSDKIVSFATSLDRFFGNERNYQESNESVLQIDFSRVAGYRGDRKFVLSGRAKLNLPKTEERLHLLLETNPEENITNQPTQTQPQSQSQPQPVLSNQVVPPASYSAALRYENQEERLWHFSTDAGIKVETPLQPFARARASLSIPLEPWRMKVSESVFWFNTLGPGETSQLDLERFWSADVLFRATSEATWLKNERNFDMHQTFAVYHTLDERTALQYQASASALSHPQYQVTEYVISALYRYRLHRKWMYFELGPQLHFPKVQNYRSRPAFGMRLEMLFDGNK